MRYTEKAIASYSRQCLGNCAWLLHGPPCTALAGKYPFLCSSQNAEFHFWNPHENLDYWAKFQVRGHVFCNTFKNKPQSHTIEGGKLLCFSRSWIDQVTDFTKNLDAAFTIRWKVETGFLRLVFAKFIWSKKWINLLHEVITDAAPQKVCIGILSFAYSSWGHYQAISRL